MIPRPASVHRGLLQPVIRLVVPHDLQQLKATTARPDETWREEHWYCSIREDRRMKKPTYEK